MSDAIETVRKFFGSIDAAVNKKDPVVIQERLGMLAEDIRYQNKPMRVIAGLDDFLHWFMEFATCEYTHCDIIRIAADAPGSTSAPTVNSGKPAARCPMGSSPAGPTTQLRTRRSD